MIIILSPAKTLDFAHAGPDHLFSLPEFSAEAATLAGKMKGYTAIELGKLMKLSSKLAYQSYDRYQQWGLLNKVPDGKQAVLAYKGDVYNGLAAWDFSVEDLKWAQGHLRILSGLYGILRPLDLIMPYRLEFAIKIKGRGYKDLYQYWAGHILTSMKELVQEEGSGMIINLASAEYFKAIDLKNLNIKVITPVFREFKNDEYRFFSMYGKKARGMMARYIIRKKLSNFEEIKLFNEEGYSFNDPLSTENEWVFTR
jgi:hypothetical protein